MTDHALERCDPATATTRSLLGYGALAGPFYVTVSLTQALTRDGFDLSRHEWSLLANGPWGWIQSANLVVTGLMVAAFAVGLARQLGGGWAPRLMAVYGAGLAAAGLLQADPALGFPPGTPEGPGAVSWHGLGHLAAAGLGFLALVAAAFVLARHLPRAWARFSRLTGALFLAGFAAVAAGGGAVVTNLAFTAAVLLAWGWLTALAVHLYRTTGTE
jgi:hypothetical protein